MIQEIETQSHCPDIWGVCEPLLRSRARTVDRTDLIRKDKAQPYNYPPGTSLPWLRGQTSRGQRLAYQGITERQTCTISDPGISQMDICYAAVILLPRMMPI